MAGPRPQGRTGGVSVAVLGVATALALVGLGRQPLWYDEVATAHAAALSWTGLGTLLGQTDANLGAYYALLHVLGGLGHSAALLRLPSALAAVGTVVLTERVGRRLLGPRTALLAAALVAVHPFATAYARDARPYSLVACASTGALLLGLRALDRPSVGRHAAYAAVSVLAVCLHLYAVLPLGAYALALLPRAQGRRPWLLAQVPVLLAALAVLAVSLTQTAQLSWVPGLSVGRVLSGLALLCGGALPALAVVAGVGVLLVARVDRRSRRVLLGGLLLPVLALLSASLLRPTFVPRYLVATVPLQCLVLAGAAAAVARRPGAARWSAATSLVAVAAWSGVGTMVQEAAPYRYEDYRAASRALLDGARPGDAVVFEQQGARLGLDYYLPRVDRPGAVLPADVLVLPGAVGQGFDVRERAGPAALLALAQRPRVWVVRHLDQAPEAVPALAPYACSGSRSFGLVALQLCHR